MRKKLIPALCILFLVSGCGRKEALLRDLDSCRKEITSHTYMIDHLKEQVKEEKQKVEEMAALEEAPPPEITLDEWEAAYVDLAERIRLALEGVKHTMDVRAGTLVVTVKSELLFPAGDQALSEEGSLIVHKIALVLKTLENRQTFIACRALDITLAKKSLKVKTNRELAVKRALAVASSLEWHGVDPKTLVAGGYNDDPVSETSGEAEADAASETSDEDETGNDDDMSNIGVVEFHIPPIDAEMPEFPALN
jgi:flagellar motor protein MotB